MSAPATWTVQAPATAVAVPVRGTVLVDINLSVPAGVSGGGVLQLEAEQVGGFHAGAKTTLDVSVTIAGGTTSVTQNTPFTQSEGVYESQVAVRWSETVGHTTFLNLTPAFQVASGNGDPGDGVLWAAPKHGGLTLDPNEVEYVMVRLLPKTNVTGRTYSLDAKIGHPIFGIFETTLVLQHNPPAAGPRYDILSIDPFMGLVMADSDRTTSYRIEFSGAGPGQYSFNLQGLPAAYTATITPATAAIAAGKCTVIVDIQRVADSPIEHVDEFVLRAIHSNPSHADDTSLRLPIHLTRGR